jgi:hypothetical protein
VDRLDGTVKLTSGSCAGDRPIGSYLSVTFGTRAIRNRASSCDHGAVTLLRRGRKGLSTSAFSPSTDAGFDGDGDARADTIVAPTSFDRRRLGLLTSARNLQDGPSGPDVFVPPKLYLVGNKVEADLRSVQVLYGGKPDSSCASASGYGCWLVGAERATGTYDASTRRLSLTWFSGQSFTSASAGTEVHLVGEFIGNVRPVAKGATVDLGTASFAAGPAVSVGDSTDAHHTVGARPKDHAHHRRRSNDAALAAAASAAGGAGSPRLFLVAELLVELNVVALVAVALRRRRR